MSNYSLSAVLSLKDGFSATINSFQRGGSAVGNAAKKMGISLDSVDKKLKGLGKGAVKGLTNVTKGLAVSLGAVGAATTALAFKGAADMETYSAMLETAFRGDKQRAQEYFKWANKFANETPFENKDVIEGAVKLTAYGLDPKKILGIAGDLAGSMGKPLDQAIEAFADAKTGELERLKEFGIKKENIIEEGEKLGFKDLVDNKGTIKDSGKFFDVLMELVKRRSEGGMKKLSETFKGQMSTIMGQTKFALARFAGMNEDGTIRVGSAFDRLKTVAASAIERINKAMEDGSLDNWITKFDGAVIKTKEYLQDIWGDLKKITGDDLRKWAETAKSAIENLGTALGGIAKTVKFLSENQTILKYGSAALVGGMVGGIPGAAIGAAIAGGYDIGKILGDIDVAAVEAKKPKVTGGTQLIPATPIDTKAPVVNITGTMNFNNNLDIDNFTKSLADNLKIQQ